SLNTMISRHEILRTTFKLADGRPTQVIAPPAPIDLPVVDLRHLPVDERETTARELVSVEAHTPFDLDRGPLLRVTLIQMDDSESLVLFTLHHIIADGWSTGVIVREFGPLYSAFARDEQPALPDLAIQYADFAVWQREWLQGDVLQQQLSYWRQQLGDESSRGAVPLLDLPTDRPRPPAPSYAGETIKFTLPQALTDEVVALSQREQVTPFMTLLAAFQVLLFRYSGQDDIAVGTPIANRNRREIEPLIGCFINTLVIRTDLSGVPSFHELLGRVRQSTLGAYDHQDLPFEVLVDALHPTRRLSHNPLFQVMFTLQNTPRVAIETPDLHLAPVDIEYQRAKFDLTLTMSETPAGLVGALEYRTDLFDTTTIERMAGHFQTLLATIVGDPQQRIDRLPLLPDQEQQILQSWNATRITTAPERWVHELFEDQVARTPEAVALILDAEQLTYAELNRRANQLAHHLRQIGVRQESLVAVCLHRSTDLVVALLAILKAGGCYVPLDPAYPADRLRWMLDDTQAAVIVSSSYQQALLPAHSAHVLCLDTDSALIDQQPTTTPEAFSSGASLAYIIYTSGSTGRPKGVGVGHAALVEHTVGIAELYELEPQDRVLEFASPSFDVSIEQILPTLISGACLVLRSADLWSPDEFTNIIVQKRLTVLNLPPVYYRAWMLALAEANTPFPQQPRLIIVGGEAFPPDTARLWRRLEHGATRLLNAYGPTETIITATLYDMSAAHDAHALLSSVPIGRPIVERTAYVLDREGAQVPIGVAGELYLGGSLLARGYLNRPDLTATQFVPDPFSQLPGARLYKTGDLVRYLADGTIEFLGRVDQQVKVRGFRIELGEIEAVLATHPAVQTALVVLRDERLVAYVVENQEPRTQNQGVEEDGSKFLVLGSALREFLAQRLPEYMVPSTFVVLPALPLTPNGKIDRKALPALGSTQIGDGESFAAPRTPDEELIAGVWASVLGVARVGIHDNFFALGGHSLLATQVVSRLRQVLSVELPLRVLFEAPTVAGLAAQLSSQRAETQSPLQPVDRSGPLPLSFAQQRLWFLDQLEPGSPLYNLPAGLRLRGTLDRDALRQSLDLLVARHESLRTTFAAVHGQPIQVIAPAAPIDLATIDLRSLPLNERQAAALELAMREARQPFDLQRGPLLRATLVLLDQDEYLLLFTLHHIITDGWSLGVLIREVATTYQALSSQRPHPENTRLPELPIQYADYAVWQREWLQGDVLHQQLDYWRQQLQGSIPLDLPTDRPRPS
ncbi:MAG TPA: amino acid adenylation domain-containing protein, partial [Herpetosiphonaceae bacterium]